MMPRSEWSAWWSPRQGYCLRKFSRGPSELKAENLGTQHMKWKCCREKFRSPELFFGWPRLSGSCYATALAWDMHKNAQKVEWKTQDKISCHYIWLLHGKNCSSRWRFLRNFLTASKPSRRSITAAKRQQREKKERRKNNWKNRKA